MIAWLSKQLLLSPNATIVLYSMLLALPGLKDIFRWLHLNEVFSHLFIPVFVATIVCNTFAVCLWRGDGIDRFSVQRISIVAAGLLTILALLSFAAFHLYQLERLSSLCGTLSEVVVTRRDIAMEISSDDQKVRFVMSGDKQKSIARVIPPGNNVCVFFEPGEHYPVEIVDEDEVVYSREQHVKANRAQRLFGGIVLACGSAVLIMLKRKSNKGCQGKRGDQMGHVS
ncbi:hypothetical protein [Novipirellula rosea]|uniref:DUF3592 domain-containing protein n=1 Tax=Novipirellula rosea TaxID=1031540 RepID=A0ABP8NDI7_9BACT